MKKTFYLAIGILVTLSLSNFVYSNYSKWQKKLQPVNINGTIIKKTFNVPSFSLHNGHNKTFTDENLYNNWSLMFFGYSRCPDVCPKTLNTIADMYHELKDLPDISQPKIIFISIDSEHDNNNHGDSDHYARLFNKNFIGLSGSKKQVSELTKSFGVVTNKVMLDKENYVFDHSNALYLINPKGQLQAVLTGPFRASDLSKDVRALMLKYS